MRQRVWHPPVTFPVGASLCRVYHSFPHGGAHAAVRPVPENLPRAALQNTTGKPLPGDAAAPEAALAAPGPVQVKILVVDSTEGEDRTAYLDRVAEKWGVPGPDVLCLVLFTEDNFNIRFYMGASFRAAGVDVDEMLGLVRSHYLDGKRHGDVAGAPADLIGAENRRMAGFGPDREEGTPGR